MEHGSGAPDDSAGEGTHLSSAFYFIILIQLNFLFKTFNLLFINQSILKKSTLNIH